MSDVMNMSEDGENNAVSVSDNENGLSGKGGKETLFHVWKEIRLLETNLIMEM